MSSDTHSPCQDYFNLHVSVDRDTRRPLALPPALREALLPLAVPACRGTAA
ncbi:acyl-CoA thioesterase family protein [Cupriavidus yeoncheonensis]|uniref:hypothetical protein n=1 Tax=Cupriavidus yeoncheonensis TaxID=1462994 RepID=UPI001BA5FBBA|nr:hypothetical protein [Cupriavidus yeoncheonensis]